MIYVRPMEGDGAAIEGDGDGIYMSTETFNEEGDGWFVEGIGLAIEGGGYA